MAVLLPLVLFSVTAQAADGDLRLCDTTVTEPTEAYPDGCKATTDIGRLEVHYDNEWRGVCDDYFTDEEAEIACKQLGHSENEWKFAKTLLARDGPSDLMT